jgi:hypothetical protein
MRKFLSSKWMPTRVLSVPPPDTSQGAGETTVLAMGGDGNRKGMTSIINRAWKTDIFSNWMTLHEVLFNFRQGLFIGAIGRG